VYELDKDFQVFPTFPVVLSFHAGDPPELMHDVNGGLVWREAR
jgi:hypothetical protein